MLILNRKEGETIAIGNDIMLTIVASYDGQVRIGISAPREIEVHREEIWNRIGVAGRCSSQHQKVRAATAARESP